MWDETYFYMTQTNFKINTILPVGHMPLVPSTCMFKTQSFTLSIFCILFMEEDYRMYITVGGKLDDAFGTTLVCFG